VLDEGSPNPAATNGTGGGDEVDKAKDAEPGNKAIRERRNRTIKQQEKEGEESACSEHT
jgi:hypothetical protein